ncbi:MAG: cytochrome c [Actinomycetota bacterium]|nr:cytochrome c [Actinomycetota bacterium]
MKIRIAIVVAWFAVVGIVGVFAMTRSNPEKHAGIVEHYKYGSIGAEGRSGVPASLWLALPEVFPDLLPEGPGEGYERVGLIYEKGRARPIGTSFRETQIGMIGLNCAVCHVGTLRTSKDAQPRIILGMPANQFNLQAYLNFLRDTGKDERFNAETLIPAMKQADPEFSRADEVLYRHYVIPRTRAALRKLDDDFRWLDVRPDEGPGRVDTFNPYKVILGISTGKTIGTADLPSLWNQRPREGMKLHWDGNNDSVAERNISAAIGAGASADSLDRPALKRIRDWILDLDSPRYPKERIDKDLAQQGSRVYAENCAACHSFKGSRVGEITPINAIGTDRKRLDSFTPDLVEKQGEGSGNLPKFKHFKKTNGYSNQPLDGVWLRAPYLHNGSVPTLADLLTAPDQRPDVFYRGVDIYDWERVGFISRGTTAKRDGFKFKTSDPGNGNGGHAYGTDLPESSKRALIEYMKTL